MTQKARFDVSMLEKYHGLALPLALTGSSLAVIASLVSIGVMGLDAIIINEPVELRVSRTVLGIAWGFVSLMGCAMTWQNFKVPAFVIMLGAVGGLVAIPSYFAAPSIFMLLGGMLYFFQKKKGS